MSILTGAANAKRIQAYEKFAFDKRMHFLIKDEFGLKAQLNSFEIFRKFRSGRIYNICKKRDAEFTFEEQLFDYKYTISTGKSSHTYRQTVYFVNSKSLALPVFHLKPEHFGHKIASLLGIDDIDFTEYPLFSKKYHLKGEHEEFIRSTFSDHVLKFFSQHHGWTIEAANYYLIFYKFNNLVDGNELDKFYDVSHGVYQLFLDASAPYLDVSLK